METKITLSGRVASIGNGLIQGIARIVNSESELGKIREGDIMIAPQTDINYVPALDFCIGLITETGGRFCHAAIYSRENNLPCITDVENARKIIPDGAEIILDTESNCISLVR